jgi:hypothetical protein
MIGSPFMDPISEYQKWKQQGESLRAQAKQAMETRFRELLSEAAGIAQEYQRDFGTSLRPPATITAFRYKRAAAQKSKKAVKAGAVHRQESQPVTHAAPDPKIHSLEKRRVQIQKKLDAAKGAGKPVKNLEDKLYEIEDELRLAGRSV